MTEEGSYHRVYPAPTETSPPINIEEGWEDNYAPAEDVPLIQLLTVSSNARTSNADYSANRPDVSLKQGDLFVPDLKKTNTSLEVLVSQGSYIPWTPVQCVLPTMLKCALTTGMNTTNRPPRNQ